MSGTLEDLSNEQRQALDQFRDIVKSKDYFNEKRHDDRGLLRFLRARKFDVKKSEEMLDAAEKWRKEFGVDDIKELDKTFSLTLFLLMFLYCLDRNLINLNLKL